MALGGAPCSGQTTQTNGAPVGTRQRLEEPHLYASFQGADPSGNSALIDSKAAPGAARRSCPRHGEEQSEIVPVEGHAKTHSPYS